MVTEKIYNKDEIKKKNVLERESMCNGPVVQKKQGMFRATLDFRDYWRKKAKRAAGKAGESKETRCCRAE